MSFLIDHPEWWCTLAAWYLQPRAIRITRTQQRLDRFVIPFDELHAQSHKRRRHALLFMHIPKTGGTTFEYIAAKNYAPNGVLQINSPTLHRNPSALFKSGGFPKCVMGHHAIGQVIYRYLDRPVAHVAIIREPVSRIISHFNYIKTSKKHALHDRVRHMSIADYVQSGIALELDNAQTRRLSGDFRRAPGKPLRDEEATLERALNNLEQRFSIVGVTDRYPELLLMCRDLLGWRDIYAVRRNVSDTAIAPEDVDNIVRRHIAEHNALDAALYERACLLVETHCEQLGITSDRIASYHAANEAHQQLLEGGAPRAVSDTSDTIAQA